VFLYEDQEGKMQNRIVQWWVKIDDARIASHSRVEVFLRAVAGLTARGFDRALGDGLISFRFAGMSLCLSIASFSLVGSIGAIHAHNPARNMFFEGVCLFVLALVPIVCVERWTLRIWWLAVLIVVTKSVGSLLYILYRVRGVAFAGRALGYVALAFAVSFVCDICYVAITRWMLRRIAVNSQVLGVISMIAANLFVLSVLVFGPFELGLKLFNYWQNGSAVIMFSLLLNAIDFVAGSAALLVGLALLVHRLLWPVLEKPLYAIQRHEVVRNKKLLWGAGLALAFLPTHMTFDFVKVALAKFG
jgi:hypothetical protein